MSTIASLIQQLRAAGLTQTAIARRTGIPQPRLSRWGAGAAAPAADDALKLASLLQELNAAGGGLTPPPAINSNTTTQETRDAA